MRILAGAGCQQNQEINVRRRGRGREIDALAAGEQWHNV